MSSSSSLLALSKVMTTTIAYSFLLVGVGIVAIILASNVFTMLLSPNQSTAFATFPGENGKIAFEREGDIYVMNPDGSGQTNISPPNGGGDDPDWSPNGTKIAFGRGGTAIIIINADGAGEETVLDPGDANWDPSWSPDGTKIAFVKEVDPCDYQIYVINADGSGSQRQLTNIDNCGLVNAPDWSPDGTKIAFDGIYVMNAEDGSGVTRLTDGSDPSWSPDGEKIAFVKEVERQNEIWVMNAADGSGQRQLTTNGGTHPSWSPDGTKIVFGSFRDGNNEIYVMNAADGSGQTRLTNNPANDIRPDWGTAIATEPAAAIDELISTIQNLDDDNVPQSLKTSLTATLKEVSNILNDNNANNDKSACGKLGAFINQVNAAEGRGILTTDQADELRTQAEDIRDELLDC